MPSENLYHFLPCIRVQVRLFSFDRAIIKLLARGLNVLTRLKIFNPEQKSKFVTKIWHNVQEKFSSPNTLKERLVKTLAEKHTTG